MLVTLIFAALEVLAKNEITEGKLLLMLGLFIS